jgi:hypothetical protein
MAQIFSNSDPSNSRPCQLLTSHTYILPLPPRRKGSSGANPGCPKSRLKPTRQSSAVSSLVLSPSSFKCNIPLNIHSEGCPNVPEMPQYIFKCRSALLHTRTANATSPPFLLIRSEFMFIARQSCFALYFRILLRVAPSVIRQVVQKPHKPHMASCGFWALCKAVGAFFRSGTVAHLQTTHFSTILHVPGMQLLSQIQLNQTSSNDIFVLLPCLPYCISCGTRSSDVPTLTHYSTKSPKFRPLTDKHGKAARLCTMAKSRMRLWHNLSIITDIDAPTPAPGDVIG